MRRSARRATAAAALLALGFGAGVAFSQAALDPVQVAPHIYETAFENDRVRVIRRTIRKGETPPLVAQPDRVVVYLNPCAWLEEDDSGEKKMRSYKYGEPVWQAANMHGGSSIPVVQECSVIEVEILQ
ncbi:MAG: hypothetical protein AAFX56_18730 [Pseudomonadota bacterium]